MTPNEEKLVLDLHSQWGNRWSRIARRLPGRTDNEIKNYWRTHMRKQAQEKKRDASPSSSPSNCCSSSSNNTTPMAMDGKVNNYNNNNNAETNSPSFHRRDTTTTTTTAGIILAPEETSSYSMDDIWKDITSSDELPPINPVYEGYSEDGSSFYCPPIASPLWEYCPPGTGTLWKMSDEEGTNILFA